MTTFHLSIFGFPHARVKLANNGKAALVENPGRTAMERSDFSRSLQDLFFSKSHANGFTGGSKFM